MKVEVARHPGASFVAGRDQIHIWAEGVDESLLGQAWDRYLVGNKIAQPLTFRPETYGRVHGHATCYPFLPVRLVHRVIEMGAAAAAMDGSLEKDLSDYGYDARMIETTYGVHRELALGRGWPAWPLMLGRMPALVLGAGRHHCLIPMNLAPTATALVGIAGQYKAVGRDLMAAYGLPPAPGGMALTPELAVTVAEGVGWPVVVKRHSGGNSDGVILNIRDAAECQRAAAELIEGGHAILVEKQIRGLELRVHFVAGRIEQIVLRQRRALAADGKSSLRSLIQQAQPDYLRLADSSISFQRQLVYRLWDLGVRTFADIDHLVPPSGQEVSLGKSFCGFRDAATMASSVSASDRKRIESFLAVCGRPSGALDIILRRPGVPLAEGGAVLEINVPSGMWYLDGVEKVAQTELNAWTAHQPHFRRTKGRIPFWIAIGHPSLSPALGQLQRFFHSHFRAGKAVTFSDVGGWVPILTESTDALLVFVNEEDIRHYGLPANLAPTVWIEGGRARFRQDHPFLAATLEHAGPGVRYRRREK